MCSRYQHFGICVLNRQKRRYFTQKGIIVRYIVRNLNIYLFVALYRNKIYLFFVDNADIGLISAP